MSLHIFAPFFSRSNPSIVGITANSGAANRNRFDTRPKTPLHSLSKYSWIDHISLSRKKISAKYNLPSNRAKLEPPVFERSERSRMIFDDRDQTQRTATGKESKNRRERSRDLTIVSTTTRGDERRRRRERERGDSTFVILIIVTIVIVVIVVTVYPACWASELCWNEGSVGITIDRSPSVSSAPLTSLLLSPSPPVCTIPIHTWAPATHACPRACARVHII